MASLGVGDRQRLEIARVLFRDAQVLILDEPTAVLSPQDAAALYATLRRLANGGRAIAVVTHKLDEVLDHADTVTVMRRGRVVSTRPVDRDADRHAQRQALLHDAFHDASAETSVVAQPADESAKVLLDIEGLKVDPALRGVRLQVRAREIVGVAGVEGNGQRELVDVLAGLRGAASGSVHARGPLEVVHEDRHARGLVIGASVADNAVLGEYARFARPLGLDLRALRTEAAKRVKDGGVSPPHIDLPARALSGGNQQKLVVARALARETVSERILPWAGPTDPAGSTLARRVRSTCVSSCRRGRRCSSARALSADLDEARSLCHRIVVPCSGAHRR